MYTSPYDGFFYCNSNCNNRITALQEFGRESGWYGHTKKFVCISYLKCCCLNSKHFSGVVSVIRVSNANFTTATQKFKTFLVQFSSVESVVFMKWTCLILNETSDVSKCLGMWLMSENSEQTAPTIILLYSSSLELPRYVFRDRDNFNLWRKNMGQVHKICSMKISESSKHK